MKNKELKENSIWEEKNSLRIQAKRLRVSEFSERELGSNEKEEDTKTRES